MKDTQRCKTLASIQEIASDFDAFIVDQFGVLHDGHHPYPSAKNTLRWLMDKGKTVIILSNSGKRSFINEQRMEKLGIARSLYTHFVTSGDVAYDTVNAWQVTATPRRCLLVARDADTSAVDGLDLMLTEEAETADLVIISASEADRYPEQHYQQLLRVAAQRQIPCLCTNPDKLMLTASGIRFGAGRIAEIYEEMGGMVQWIGKPYQSIYAYASRLLGTTASHRVLCVGDSLEHDIVGGLNSGFKTLFVSGGIHQDLDKQQLEESMQRHQAVPHFHMRYFA